MCVNKKGPTLTEDLDANEKSRPDTVDGDIFGTKQYKADLEEPKQMT